MIKSCLLGYNPRCSIYPKRRSTGTKYYISYYLPNRIRMQRLCHEKKGEARRLMHMKQHELEQGIFDEQDQAKMPEIMLDHPEVNRMKLTDSIEKYLEMTSGSKKPKTIINDRNSLENLFEHFRRNGKIYMDEITPLDVQHLINLKDKEGKSQATLGHYKKTLHKIFNWLIEDMGILDMKNPAKKVKIPKKMGIVRDHIPDNSEIQALITAEYEEQNRFSTPIQAIVKFLIFTGARVGEVLHAEWDDFDLDQGIWYLRNKPNCPTIHRVGWTPKTKDREVHLFPEAIEVLKAQPQHKEVFGHVRICDDSRKLLRKELIPANFVFPKCEMRLENGKRRKLYTRIDVLTRAWNTLKQSAGIENLQLKDLRTYFNTVILIGAYGFTNKEAGTYIGNSEVVNIQHYEAVNNKIIGTKIKSKSLSQVLNSES